MLSFNLCIFFLSIYLGIFLQVACGLQTIYLTLHSLFRVSILPLQVIYRTYVAVKFLAHSKCPIMAASCHFPAQCLPKVGHSQAIVTVFARLRKPYTRTDFIFATK